PVYVGTDSNISFQGTPRIESPGGAGPFDFRQAPVPLPRPGVPAAPVTPAPQNLAPSSLPSDAFRPAPVVTPAPLPTPRPPFGGAGAMSQTTPLVLDFDPPNVSLAVGEQK